MRKLLTLLWLLLLVQAEAQITFVNASTERFASNTAVSPAEPASAAEDDFFVGLTFTNDETGSWTVPSGWTEVDNLIYAEGTGHWVLSHIKRGASAPALGWTYSGAAAAIRTTIYAFRGVHTTTPLDVTYVRANHFQQLTNDPTGANPAITTLTDNSMILLLQTLEFSGSSTPGAPSGYTLDATGDGNTPQHLAAYKILASLGTETPGVWTHVGANSGDDPTEQTLALREASTDNALLRRRGR